mmetsp:Transcript_81194/g.143833  ORF Transcript_81194/g.143833 Transcript_81194/m.143833 type:complete len:212 (+) Transcript_81194:657-1292(+)
MEGLAVENCSQDPGILKAALLCGVAECCLAELAGSHVVGHVRPHQHRNIVAQQLPQGVRAEVELVVLEVQTSFDQTNGNRCVFDNVNHSCHRPWDKLVWHNPHQDVGIACSTAGVWVCHYGCRKLDTRKILDILMLLIDDLHQGSLLLACRALHLLIEDPHLDSLIEEPWLALHVVPDDLGNSASPISTSHNANLLGSITSFQHRGGAQQL